MQVLMRLQNASHAIRVHKAMSLWEKTLQLMGLRDALVLVYGVDKIGKKLMSVLIFRSDILPSGQAWRSGSRRFDPSISHM